ncbi:MAG: helix-turn-helix transcriptional regulator [Bacteroidia bacterium]|nr:helix-turn-helix transcriptional regulator [Bacteroidia bacterium]
MSSKEVADYLNMSTSAYSALESGVTKLDIERAAKLSKLYGIKIDELINPHNQILEIVENFYKAEITDIKNDLSEIKESLTQIKNKLEI